MRALCKVTTYEIYNNARQVEIFCSFLIVQNRGCGAIAW
jgi:hypothetical protein